MTDHEKEAKNFVAAAEKKNTKSFFSFLSSDSDRGEESIDLYEKAANHYKMAQNWSEAAKCYTRAGELSLKQPSKFNAATLFVSAATVQKKVDPQKAIQLYQKAIDLNTETNRFTMVAKHHVSIAELYETTLVDISKAIENYEKAITYYQTEDYLSSARQYKVVVAKLYATKTHYDKAAELFEQVGLASQDNKLLVYSVRDHFFKATLCSFAIDQINGRKALDQHQQSCPTFSDSRECKLLQKISEALEQDNVDAFTKAVKDHDQVARLEPWITTLLLTIKKQLSSDHGAGGADGDDDFGTEDGEDDEIDIR